MTILARIALRGRTRPLRRPAPSSTTAASMPSRFRARCAKPQREIGEGGRALRGTWLSCFTSVVGQATSLGGLTPSARRFFFLAHCFFDCELNSVGSNGSRGPVDVFDVAPGPCVGLTGRLGAA